MSTRAPHPTAFNCPYIDLAKFVRWSQEPFRDPSSRSPDAISPLGCVAPPPSVMLSLSSQDPPFTSDHRPPSEPRTHYRVLAIVNCSCSSIMLVHARLHSVGAPPQLLALRQPPRQHPFKCPQARVTPSPRAAWIMPFSSTVLAQSIWISAWLLIARVQGEYSEYTASPWYT